MLKPRKVLCDMAIQAFTFAALGGSLSRNAITGLSGGIAGSLFAPLSRVAAYAANSGDPNALPSVEMAIHAHNMGLLSWGDYKTIMDRNGALAGNGDEFHERIWAKMRLAGRHYPSIEDVMALKWSESPTKDGIAQLEERSGGTISWFEDLKSIRSDYAAVIQLLEMLNRGLITRDKYFEIMKLKGYYHYNHNWDIEKLRFHVPSSQDVIHFLVREVYNEELRKEYQLDAEWEENKSALPWLAMNGMGKGFYVNPETGESFSHEVARDYWANHWRNASIGEVMQMFHRFRPGRDGIDPDIVVVATKEEAKNHPKSISIDQFLKLEDFSPVWRKRLRELSRPVLGRMDLVRSWRVGAFDRFGDKKEEELAEKFKDLGYSDENAKIQADSVILQETRTLTKLAKRSTIQQIRRMFKNGLISEDFMREGLKEAGLKLDEVQLTVLRIKLEVKSDYYETYIKSVKRMYMQFRIAEDQALSMLGGKISAEPFGQFTEPEQIHKFGVTYSQTLRLTEIVDLWRVERLSRRRELTASQLTHSYIDGLIEQADFKDRLRMMNYSPTGIDEVLAMANLKKHEALEKAMKAVEASDIRMKRRPTLKMLEGWFRSGEMKKPEVEERLRAHGFREDDINKLIKEWESGHPADLPK